MFNSRTVLVTGATGFIGRHLSRKLAAEGHSVSSVQRKPEIVPGVAETLVMEELSGQEISRLLEGRRFDWVFHLASHGVRPNERSLEPMFRVNVEATRCLTVAAATWPARSFIIAGSGSEYDLARVDAPVSEDQPLEMFKLYGASKAAGSLCALSSARSLGLPTAIGRIFGVFGPGEAEHRLLPSLVRHLTRGQRVPLSDGRQRRDFLAVDDVVGALLALAHALEREPRQGVFNIGTGAPVSIRRFSEIVASVLAAPLDLLGFGDLPSRPDDVACFSGNPSRLKAYASWRPRLSLEDGVRSAVGALAIAQQREHADD
jgi:nucleoside-diphosphate-sugar epimerase